MNGLKTKDWLTRLLISSRQLPSIPPVLVVVLMPLLLLVLLLDAPLDAPLDAQPHLGEAQQLHLRLGLLEDPGLCGLLAGEVVADVHGWLVALQLAAVPGAVHRLLGPPAATLSVYPRSTHMSSTCCISWAAVALLSRSLLRPQASS